MKNELLTISISLVWLAIMQIQVPAESLAAEISSSVQAASTPSTRELDDFVRRYASTMRAANSVEALVEFVPKSRMKKFRTTYSPKQQKEWLRFRKQMPVLGSLVKHDEQSRKAVLIYNTPDEVQAGKKRKMMAKITLIQEDRQWKILQEDFASAKNILKVTPAPNNR